MSPFMGRVRGSTLGASQGSSERSQVTRLRIRLKGIPLSATKVEGKGLEGCIVAVTYRITYSYISFVDLIRTCMYTLRFFYGSLLN